MTPSAAKAARICGVRIDQRSRSKAQSVRPAFLQAWNDAFWAAITLSSPAPAIAKVKVAGRMPIMVAKAKVSARTPKSAAARFVSQNGMMGRKRRKRR